MFLVEPKQEIFHPHERISGDPGTYLLRAGEMHGICHNAEFAVYDNERLSPIGTLVVQEVSLDTSRLSHKRLDKLFTVPQPGFALETRKGHQERVRIAVLDVDTKKSLLAYDLRGIALVDKGEDADLLLIQ